MTMGVLDVAPCLGTEMSGNASVAPIYHFLSFIAFSFLPE